MNLDKKNTFLSFLLAFTLFLVTPALLPSLRLTFFAPFLIILYYQKPFIPCLWNALLCGLILDIFSSHTRLGLFAFNYLLTTLILFRQKRHFFADHLSTMPIMVFFFGILSTLIHLVLLNIFDKGFSMSWKWFYSDLIFMPLYDAIYAFVVFIMPFVILGPRPRRGRDYFLLR